MSECDNFTVIEEHIEVEVNEDDEMCSEASWTSLLLKYSFATEGVALFTVAIVGVIANSVSIAVLTQRTMKTQISALLITLAVFDLVFLCCTFPVFTVQSVNNFVYYLNTCKYPEDQIEFMSPGVTNFYHLTLPYIYGMTHVSKVGSVFTTLAVSLERYFAVCKPLWIRIRRCHPGLYIVTVTLFAFAFNVPKFLEFETRTVNNTTVLEPSPLRTNAYYVIYYNFLTKTILTEIFPYVSLIFFNACIYREIRRSVKIQQLMRCTQSQKEEIKSANVVVGVVLLSIMCHIWKILPDLYEAIEEITKTQATASQPPTTIETPTATQPNAEGRIFSNCSFSSMTFVNATSETGDPHDSAINWSIEFIIDTSHLLVGINSAANFFIYYILRKNFRAATRRLIARCFCALIGRRPQQQRGGGNGTTGGGNGAGFDADTPTKSSHHRTQSTIVSRRSISSFRNGGGGLSRVESLAEKSNRSSDEAAAAAAAGGGGPGMALVDLNNTPSRLTPHYSPSVVNKANTSGSSSHHHFHHHHHHHLHHHLHHCASSPKQGRRHHQQQQQQQQRLQPHEISRSVSANQQLNRLCSESAAANNNPKHLLITSSKSFNNIKTQASTNDAVV